MTLTNKDLINVQTIITQIRAKLNNLSRYILRAKDGIQDIELTANQITSFKTKYVTEKAEIAKLFKQLP